MFKSLKKGEYRISHDRSTRQTDYAVPIFHRLSLTQRSVSYLGPSTWNSLPHELRDIQKLGTFKRLLKEYLLDSY